MSPLRSATRPRVTILVAVLAAVTLASGCAASAADRVIVALGDSLTAGWGVAPDEAWPALLQARLGREGFPYRVVNAGASSDTSAGGLARLDWVLRNDPEIVIVALGANDGLRGQPVSALRANLTAIVERLRARGVKVLLAGMRLPPNYGAAFADDFGAVFAEVARRTRVPLLPFLLDGVAADPRWNQGDGIHPNAAGHRIIAERLWPHLKPLLAASPARGSRLPHQARPRRRRAQLPPVPLEVTAGHLRARVIEPADLMEPAQRRVEVRDIDRARLVVVRQVTELPPVGRDLDSGERRVR